MDSEELLHLALAASGQDRGEQAIGYLKRALDLSPRDANIHYLLGAEHAQIGMYDRAISDMTAALELNPALDTARFQLGLLYLTSMRVPEAITTWQPLDQLGSGHPFYLFKTGLISLANDDFTTCVKLLEQGIAANNINLVLNADMQRVIDQVKAQTPSADSSGQHQQGKPETPASHLFLSAYQKDEQ